MTQAPVSKPTLMKTWDEKRGRMVILLKNGDVPLRDVTVEDAYPSAIAGVLCFAKVGGIAPMAIASEGRIAWKVANLRPGEVKELVYTALTRETLRDPGVARRPLATDAAMLASMVGVMPGLVIGGAPAAEATPPEVRIEPPAVQVQQETRAMGPGIKAEKHGVVVAVGAGKGGTGKTTFSINLGVALSENGFRTVLMDADASMSNLSTYIGMDPEKMQTTLHDVLAGEAEPEKAIYKVFNERLRVVPSGLSIEGFLKMDRELLKDVIEYFSRDSDFIVIDT
ncbi:MAG TPA: AAA family ATPase, partial [Methanocellaceae archaeon]